MSIRRFKTATSGLLVALFLVLPMHFQIVKLGLAIIIIGISHLTQTIRLSKDCILWNFIFFFFNLTYILYGVVQSNPGVYAYIPTYLLWPVLFTILSGCFNFEDLKSLLKIIYVSLNIIIFCGIIAFLKFNLAFDYNGSLLLFDACVRPGFPLIGISSPLITCFIFWFFFYFTLIFVNERRPSFSNYLLIFAGVIFIVITTRRILYLSFPLSLAIILCLVKFLNNSAKRKILNRVKVIVGCIGLLLTISVIWLVSVGLVNENTFMDFLEQTSEKSDAERSDQMVALITEWTDHPIFGVGTGVNASVSRSETPGMYEMTYVAKLFETGLIGLTIYVGLWGVLFYWTYKCLRRDVIKPQYIIATLVSMSIFMFSNATNPYLLAFDYIWYMYVPFVIINIEKSAIKLLKNVY